MLPVPHCQATDTSGCGGSLPEPDAPSPNMTIPAAALFPPHLPLQPLLLLRCLLLLYGLLPLLGLRAVAAGRRRLGWGLASEGVGKASAKKIPPLLLSFLPPSPPLPPRTELKIRAQNRMGGAAAHATAIVTAGPGPRGSKLDSAAGSSRAESAASSSSPQPGSRARGHRAGACPACARRRRQAAAAGAGCGSVPHVGDGTEALERLLRPHEANMGLAERLCSRGGSGSGSVELCAFESRACEMHRAAVESSLGKERRFGGFCEKARSAPPPQQMHDLSHLLAHPQLVCSHPACLLRHGSTSSTPTTSLGRKTT